MIGQTVTHYQILECLGGGGMGVVYKAEDLKLHRPVALKFLPPEMTRDPDAKLRFLHEARAISRLDHPNICTVHEIDETDDGRVFMVMACYDGETLKKKIERGPLSFEEAVAVAFHVGAGLARAHEAGIVHRDIKPANIMVTARGEVKILDFGLAKLIGQTALTHTGATMGTAHYMSPEQARGAGVDHRTDIWSLGVVLYEMVTGKVPFAGEHPTAVIYNILNVNPRPASAARPDIPPALDQIIQRAMQKDPAARYPSVTELMAALAGIGGDRKFQSYQSIETTPLPAAAPERLTPPPLPRRRLLRALAIPAGILAIAAILMLVFSPSGNTIRGWFGLNSLPADKYLAILPFAIDPKDPDTRILADGLADMLALRLSPMEKPAGHFWTVSPSDLMDTLTRDPAGTRRVHGATLVLSGTLQRRGENLRLEVKLIDTATGREVERQEWSDHMSSVSTFQQGLILAVIRMLGLDPGYQTGNLPAAGGTALPGAYIAYIRGLGCLRRWQEDTLLDRGIRLFRQAVEQDPMYAAAQAGLGEACRRKFPATNDRRWLDEAVAAERAAVRLQPSFAPFHLYQGLALQDAGNPEDAIKKMDQSLQLSPGYFDACIALGRLYLQQKRLKEAEEIFLRATRLRPDYWISYSNLGYFYFLCGRYPEAEKMFQAAIRTAPGNATPYSNLAAVFFKMSQTEAAIKAMGQSLAIAPTVEGYSNLGTICFYDGRFTEAAANFEKALTLDAAVRDFLVWGNLAESCRQVPGLKKRAEEALRNAIRLAEDDLKTHPDNYNLRSSLALYYTFAGRREDAAVEIAKARKSAPTNLEILAIAIRVSELSGRREEALQNCQEYIDRFGSMETIDKDPDLAGLRRDPNFRKLTGKTGDRQ